MPSILKAKALLNTGRIALTQMPTVPLLGNTAPVWNMTDVTNQPLQLCLPTEVGYGFIMLDMVQSCD